MTTAVPLTDHQIETYLSGLASALGAIAPSERKRSFAKSAPTFWIRSPIPPTAKAQSTACFACWARPKN